MIIPLQFNRGAIIGKAGNRALILVKSWGAR